MSAAFAIAHVSDFHFGRMFRATKTRYWRKRLGVSEHSFALAVGMSNALGALNAEFDGNVLVAITGDQTTSANPAAFEVVANYINREIMISADTATGLNLRGQGCVVPGNHDMFMRSLLTTQDRSRVYGEYLPTVFPAVGFWPSPLGCVTVFSLDSNRLAGLNFLNSKNLMRMGEVGEQQRGVLSAMRGTLRARTRPDLPANYDYEKSFKVVLLHHHLARKDGRVALSQLRDATQVIQLFEQMGIDLVLCGHEHEPYEVAGLGRFAFSCAGSATKEDERANSFKVYRFEAFDRIYMDLYLASTVGGIYTFLKQPEVRLI